MPDEKRPPDAETGSAISIPRRSFLLGAGTGVASGVA